MNNYSDNVRNLFNYKQVLNDNPHSCLPSVTAMLDSYQRILNSMPSFQAVNNLTDALKQIKPAYFDTVAINKVWHELANINVKFESSVASTSISKIIERFNELLIFGSAVTRSLEKISIIMTNCENIFSQLDLISEDEMNILLSGSDYTRESVLEDIGVIKDEFEQIPKRDDSNPDTTTTLPEDIVNKIYQKCPALAYIMFLINIIMTVVNGGQVVDEFFAPIVQTAIVMMQGNEDMLFVKVESAKLYEDASSYSSIVMRIPYGEEVRLLESVKLWDKVVYTNFNGEEIVGWIAKRNLLTYQDYYFESEDLYNIE